MLRLRPCKPIAAARNVKYVGALSSPPDIKAKLGDTQNVRLQRAADELAFDPYAGKICAGWNITNEIGIIGFLPLRIWLVVAHFLDQYEIPVSESQ